MFVDMNIYVLEDGFFSWSWAYGVGIPHHKTDISTSSFTNCARIEALIGLRDTGIL